MTKTMKEIIDQLDKCSLLEIKGILYFTVGAMSNNKYEWSRFSEAVQHGINANTWQRKGGEVSHD